MFLKCLESDKKTAPKLKEMGILTIGDVANYDNYNNYVRLLGKMHFYYIEKPME